MKCLSYTQFFEVIANKTRLRIIESLFRSPKSVTEICNDIKEEQSKVSHNLKILTDCSFSEFKKDGKKRVYSLNEKTIIPLMNIVDKHAASHCKKCQMLK
ncbi:transcriptional regulator [Candidatus Woesearchaeota archaeon]|nr:transcriptional regulator [Candidatus Woesearchaeota archaeon]|tara:strand:- start:1700 stop:1999 length:300 start_codon:yes stop_codon:yes gene_type:complete